MTQQSFTRRGAVDLSAFGAAAASPAPAGAGAVPGTSSSAYSTQVSQENFPAVLEASVTAPVVLVMISPSRAPQSAQYAADVAAVAEGYDGRFLVGIVDLDTQPEIGAALQVAEVPTTYVVVGGRPATQPIPGVLYPEEISTFFQQLGQQLTAQGIGGRHAPHALAAPAAAEGEEPALDPRYAPAQDALAAGDIATAVAEYQRLVEANPADAEAAAGLAMAKVLLRTQGVDAQAARAAAQAAPDDIEAQTLAADLDLVDGLVAEAFERLVGVVRRTVDPERGQAREHLVALFAAVGNDDPRVLEGRRALANALF